MYCIHFPVCDREISFSAKIAKNATTVSDVQALFIKIITFSIGQYHRRNMRKQYAMKKDLLMSENCTRVLLFLSQKNSITVSRMNSSPETTFKIRKTVQIVSIVPTSKTVNTVSGFIEPMNATTIMVGDFLLNFATRINLSVSMECSCDSVLTAQITAKIFFTVPIRIGSKIVSGVVVSEKISIIVSSTKHILSKNMRFSAGKSLTI